MAMPKVIPTIKVCAYCGKEFQAGGRGRSNQRAKYCSRKCSAFVRIKKAKVNGIALADAAYIAGVFDGEGSIILWDRKYGGRKQLRCTVSNTNEMLMNYLIDKTGTGSVVKHTYPPEKGYKVAMTWQCYGQNAVALLEALMPYLIIKRDKAVEAIASQQVIAGG